MLRAGDRLDRAALVKNFAPVPAALDVDEALVEAARCLFCFDAPCTRSCPTAIDVPRFIRQVLHRNEVGAARTILDANIFGGSCARACPTEVLCEGACVDHTLMKAPVQIGRLQRHACDTAAERGVEFFEPGPPTGRRVAIVGSGPAGLSCAHALRRFGHEVVVFESRGVPGGLDALGIAAYKIPVEFALAEIESIARIGIEIRLNHRVEADQIPGLLAEYDAVFLGIGMGRTAPLGIEGEDLPGVVEALDFIFAMHQQPFEDCEVGRHVVVIGGGNTAIDVATAATRLGAESVTIAYRRGVGAMPAFAYEYGLAQNDGVRFEWHALPLRVVATDGVVAGVEFIRVESTATDGRAGTIRPVAGSEFILPADMVVKALGQVALIPFLDALPALTHDRGRISVDPTTRVTTVPGLFAGGDCLRNGGEVVDAVQDGKLAARGIDHYLNAKVATDGTRMKHG